MKDKIIKESEIVSKLANQDKKKVLVGGCFDILHYGHFSFLQSAKQEGDLLIVALESDEFIITKKKRPPVHTQMQRAELLAGLEIVDNVILLPLMQKNEDYAQLVINVQPSVIAVTEGDIKIQYKKEHAKLVNAAVKTVTPVIHDFSTSSIITYANLLRD